MEGRREIVSEQINRRQLLQRTMRYALLSLEIKLRPVNQRDKATGFDLLSETAC